MIGLALTLITYIWHYALARLVYDQFIRPAFHGRLTAVLLLCGLADMPALPHCPGRVLDVRLRVLKAGAGRLPVGLRPGPGPVGRWGRRIGLAA